MGVSNTKKKSVVIGGDMLTEADFRLWCDAKGHKFTHVYVDDDGFVDGATMETEEGCEAYWQLLCGTGEEVFL